MHLKLHFTYDGTKIFHKHIFKSHDKILKNCIVFKMIGMTYSFSISEPYQAKVWRKCESRLVLFWSFYRKFKFLMKPTIFV